MKKPGSVQHSVAGGPGPEAVLPLVPGVPSAAARPAASAWPLDPTLAAAGAYYNEAGELVRDWKIHAGPPEEVRNMAGVVVRRLQKYWTRQRHVAPPGMSLEEARARGLDFYAPDRGWIRAGVKPERDYPENLGSGYEDRGIDVVEEAVLPEALADPTPVGV